MSEKHEIQNTEFEKVSVTNNENVQRKQEIEQKPIKRVHKKDRPYLLRFALRNSWQRKNPFQGVSTISFLEQATSLDFSLQYNSEAKSPNYLSDNFSDLVAFKNDYQIFDYLLNNFEDTENVAKRRKLSNSKNDKQIQILDNDSFSLVALDQLLNCVTESEVMNDVPMVSEVPAKKQINSTWESIMEELQNYM